MRFLYCRLHVFRRRVNIIQTGAKVVKIAKRKRPVQTIGTPFVLLPFGAVPPLNRIADNVMIRFALENFPVDKIRLFDYLFTVSPRNPRRNKGGYFDIYPAIVTVRNLHRVGFNKLGGFVLFRPTF